MTIQNIVAILGLLGIGGLASGYFTLLWRRRGEELAKRQEYRETRYKCIILLMHGCLDFIRSLGEFIQAPSDKSLVKAALNIRKDLWGVKTKLSVADIPELPEGKRGQSGAFSAVFSAAERSKV